MYNPSLPPDEASVDFLQKVHSQDPGSFPNMTTSLGVSSYQLLAQAVASAQAQTDPVTILDLACGDGELLPVLLAEFGDRCQIVAADMSEHQLEVAKARFSRPNITFQREMAQQLSVPDASVDAVLCHMGLMLMRPVEPVLAEVARVLKPGGIFSAIVARAGQPKGIDEAYVNIAQPLIEQEMPELLENGLGDKRVLSERGIVELVTSNGSFQLPLTLEDFYVEMMVTCEEYLHFISENYFWYILSAPAREQITSQVKALFQPYGTQRTKVSMASRQITMARQ